MNSLSAGWVIPADGAPIRDGRVTWEDGRVVDVSPGRGERHYENAIILPGLVNAHSHLEYAVYAGFGDGEPFGQWMGTHITRKRALDFDDMVAIACRGAADCLTAGITTTADYSFSGAAAVAAARLGLRAIVYLEVFGSDPAGAASQLAQKQEAAGSSPLVTLGVSPHAPFTCSIAVYEWALSLGLPVGTHLAESANENDWLASGAGPLAANAAILVPPTGKRAVQTLESVLGPTLLCAHCVEVDDTDVALLAELDVPVAHCPRSNALLGCGVAPLADFLAADMRVGLGTDSPASTPSFDLWEEMRAAIYASRGRERRPDSLSAAAALELATAGAARALDLTGEVGVLAPGARADITVLSIAGSPYDPVEDPIVAAVFGGSPDRILETIVDGTTRYRQGETSWHEVHSTASTARARMLA